MSFQMYNNHSQSDFCWAFIDFHCSGLDNKLHNVGQMGKGRCMYVHWIIKISDAAGKHIKVNEEELETIYFNKSKM